MYKTNSPEVKNSKRKIALKNLEKTLKTMDMNHHNAPVKIARIHDEMDTLKKRIVG